MGKVTVIKLIKMLIQKIMDGSQVNVSHYYMSKYEYNYADQNNRVHMKSIHEHLKSTCVLVMHLSVIDRFVLKCYGMQSLKDTC